MLINRIRWGSVLSQRVTRQKKMVTKKASAVRFLSKTKNEDLTSKKEPHTVTSQWEVNRSYSESMIS